MKQGKSYLIYDRAVSLQLLFVKVVFLFQNGKAEVISAILVPGFSNFSLVLRTNLTHATFRSIRLAK